MGSWDFLVCCFSGHLLALPAAAGTAAASAASAAASAAALVFTTAFAVVTAMVFQYNQPDDPIVVYRKRLRKRT